jgi:hypothetical protein
MKKITLKEALTDLLAIVLQYLFYALIVTALWNYVAVVVISGLNPLNYWQGLGLLTLSKILLGRFEVV